MTELDDGAGAASPKRSHRSIVVRHPQLTAIIAAEGLSATGDAVFWVGLLVWLLDQPHGTGLVALAVATIGVDDWFGEIGLLRQTPRTAAVVAASDAEVWEIPGSEFWPRSTNRRCHPPPCWRA